MGSRLDLSDVVIIGRTFEEYIKMFKLSDKDKCAKILDVASGVSSFCAQANRHGYDVTACDRIYDIDSEMLRQKAGQDLDQVIKKLADASNLYKWEYFKDVAALKTERKTAYSDFLDDFESADRAKYIFADFPKSGFYGGQFDICLSSHFLFMYDELFDYEFHRKVIREMLKISSKEIRIFPLVNLKGKRSGYLSGIIHEVFDSGFAVSIEKSDYEFVKNGNEMLIISK